MRNNKKRVIYSLLILGLFFLTVIISPSVCGQSKSLEKRSFGTNAIDSFFEDFSTTTYRDGSSTVSGWGLDGVMNIRNYTWEHLDFVETVYPAYSLAVQGQKAYVNAYNETTSTQSLQVFDVANPSQIRKLGFRSSISHSYTCEVDGDYLYVGTSDATFDSYNIQDPFTLAGPGVFLDWFDTDGAVTDIDIEGHLVYYTVYDSVSSRSLGMAYTEDPSTLSPIITDWNSNTGLGLDVEGDLAYVASSEDGFYVINVTDKYTVTQYGHIDTLGNATDVLIDGSLAYVADGFGGIVIIDVFNPANPAILGGYNTPGNARRMILQEDTLFVADEDGGIQVLDVSNPNHPLLMVELLTTEVVYDVDLVGGILVATTNEGIHTFRIAANWGLADISGAAYPNPFDQYAVLDVKVQGDIAYIVGGTDGFYTVDVSNPAAPVFLDNIATGLNLRKLDVDGQFAYAVANNGWQIFDISDPANLVLLGNYAGGGLTDVDAEGEIIYISFTTGVSLVNVSNPTSISIINNYITGINGNNTAIWVDGRQIYMVEGAGAGTTSNSFSTYLATDFSAIAFSSGITRSIPMYDVHISGDCAYLGAGGWMALHNVSNPSAITYPDYVTTTSWGTWAFGTNVLSAELANGVAFYDTSDVTNIQPIGRYANATAALQITTNGDYTYIANQTNLIILRHHYSAASTFIPGTAFAQSTEIDTITSMTIKSATLDAMDFIQTGTHIDYFMSADGGAHWESVTPGIEHIFLNPGEQLLWKANITGSEDRSAYIYSINIEYVYQNENPTQPTLNNPGEIFDNQSVLITWLESTDDSVFHYELQMSTVDDFSTLVDSWNLTTDEILLSNLSAGTYYLRLRAVDQFEFTSPWSNATLLVKSSTPSSGLPLWAILTIAGGGLVLITVIVVVTVVVVRKKKAIPTR